MIEKKHPTFLKKYLSSFSKSAFVIIVSIGLGFLLGSMIFPENIRAASLAIGAAILIPLLYFIENNKFKVRCPECSQRANLVKPEKENDFYFAVCSSCEINWNLGIQKKDETSSK